MNHAVLKTNGKEATCVLLLVQCFDLTDRAPLLRALLPTQCDLPWVTGQCNMGTAEACLLKKHEVISHQAISCTRTCLFSKSNSAIKKKKLLVLINEFSKVAGYKVSTEILCCISTQQ